MGHIFLILLDGCYLLHSGSYEVPHRSDCLGTIPLVIIGLKQAILKKTPVSYLDVGHFFHALSIMDSAVRWMNMERLQPEW